MAVPLLAVYVVAPLVLCADWALTPVRANLVWTEEASGTSTSLHWIEDNEVWDMPSPQRPLVLIDGSPEA